MNKQALRKTFSPLNVVSFAAGIALLAFLLLQIDFKNLSQQVLKIQPAYLLAGGLLYLAKSLVRSLRFVRLNELGARRFAMLLRITLATSLASQILPLKLGELAYVYLIKKENDSSVSQGLSSLVIIRIFDLLAIALLFILAGAVFGLPAGMSTYFYSILGFLGLLVLILLGLLFAGRHASRISNLLLAPRLFPQLPLVRKVQNALNDLFLALGKHNQKKYAEMASYALVEWLFNFAMFHALLAGLSLSPRLFDTITAVAFAALASVLPVNSFGNFGTQEVGWATGLVLLGYTQETALTSGFATHFLTLFYMLVLGGIAWLSYLARVRLAPAVQEPDPAEKALS